MKLLPGYPTDIEPGAGLSVLSGGVKIVLHTTETPRGSWQAVRNLWKGPGNWGKGLPHFLADGDRYVQLLPLDVGAYTLENAPGGVDTNRVGPAIQVEICGYSAEGLNEQEYQALGKWIAALVKAGLPINWQNFPIFYGQDAGFTLASYNARQRMSASQFQSFDGICGHQHVPENAHWDPGKLDTNRLKTIIASNLTPSSLIPPLQVGVDMYAKFARHTPGSGWIIWFTKIEGKPDTPVFKVWCPTEAAVNMWKNDYKVEDAGYADYVLDGLPLLGAGPA